MTVDVEALRRAYDEAHEAAMLGGPEAPGLDAAAAYQERLRRADEAGLRAVAEATTEEEWAALRDEAYAHHEDEAKAMTRERDAAVARAEQAEAEVKRLRERFELLKTNVALWQHGDDCDTAYGCTCGLSDLQALLADEALKGGGQ